MSARISAGIRAGLVGLSAAALLVTAVPTAQADPDAVAKAKAQVEELSMQAAAYDQEALGAQEQLEAAQARLRTREADVAAQSGRVDAMRRQVGQVALAQFQQGSVNPVTQIFLRSDPEGFMSQFATVQQVGTNQNGMLQDFQSEQANLADMKRGAAADVATIDAAGRRSREAQASAAARLADARGVLDRLTREERERLEAERAREAREAADRAEAATAASIAQPAQSAPTTSAAPSASARPATPSARPSASRSAAPAAPASSGAAPAAAPAGAAPAASGRASTALAFAKAQLGKPYVYGGVGPSGYDCSGLTMKAWAAAGVSLPRTSQAQAAAGRRVSISELQPGDLVLYGSLSHVGLYVGNGVVIHAPHTGDVVRYTTTSGFSFGVRVG